MASINNQATLRTAITDWLNRGDLIDSSASNPYFRVDQFIEMAEARVYEILRITPLESISSFSVEKENSNVTIPAGLLEIIDLRKKGAGTCSVAGLTTRATCLANDPAGVWTDTDSDDDITLNRVDSRAFHNEKLPHSYTAELKNILITDSLGNRDVEGEYFLKYYKSDDPIGTLSTVTAGAFVVDSVYTIVSAGTTDFTTIGAAANTVGTVFTATGVGSGTGTATVELIPFILGSEYELILFSSLAVGSTFLSDPESEAHYNEMFFRKVGSLMDKESKSKISGGNFRQHFTAAGI